MVEHMSTVCDRNRARTGLHMHPLHTQNNTTEVPDENFWRRPQREHSSFNLRDSGQCGKGYIIADLRTRRSLHDDWSPERGSRSGQRTGRLRLPLRTRRLRSGAEPTGAPVAWSLQYGDRMHRGRARRVQAAGYSALFQSAGSPYPDMPGRSLHGAAAEDFNELRGRHTHHYWG